MTLIKSISGIRGTIGGKPGESLTPFDIVAFTAAYSLWVKGQRRGKKSKVIIGRDARVSGRMVENIISATLCSMGIDVINLGLAATPSVEMAVTHFNADGGIIITASHNPANWNAMKLLNANGEFISDAEGKKIVEYAEQREFLFESYENIGSISDYRGFDDIHIKKILELPLVNITAIRERNFRVVIDAVNSVGGIIIPALLKALGVKEVIELN